MANLLYAWEFGANLGHVGAFLPLAQQLSERGHDVHFCLAQVSAGVNLLSKQGYRWLQSPTVPESPRPGPPVSYADILLRFGYDNPVKLTGLVVAWRELLRLTETRLVLPDHAPTAILAARTLRIPVLTYSYGFCVPPPLTPTPNMRPWLQVDSRMLADAEELALASMNSVLARFGQPALSGIADLFGVQEPSLMTFPELDHYAHSRGSATYWGCLLSSISGANPNWPPGNGPRVFGYLRSEIRHAESVLAALGHSGYPSLVVFPDIPADMFARHQYSNLRISTDPVETSRVLNDANLAITYGGHGLTAAFLLAGKPLLLLPGQLEQYLLARRIEEIGAGLLVDPEQPATDLPFKLQRIAIDPLFAANAQAFARKYAAFPQDVVVANLVRRIEEICS